MPVSLTIWLILILPFATKVLAAETPQYRIGPGDMLELSVYPDASLNRVVTVRQDGTIPVPLLGNVPVSGATPEEVAQRLEALLKNGYYQKPQVEVVVKGYVYNRIAVLGAVRAPGTYPLFEGEGLREVFSRTGGLEKEASGGIVLFDPQGSVTATRVDLLFAPHVTLPELHRGMILYFPSRQGIYVMGEVRSPGMFSYEETLTLLRAISLAGGFSPRAQTHKVVILRRGERLEVDAEAIVEENQEDPRLEAGDLIFVPERFF